MNEQQHQLSAMARRAVEARNWPLVDQCATALIQLNRRSAEGYFLQGLAHKAASRLDKAASVFKKVLAIDATRYDAAVELAYQHLLAANNNESLNLLRRYTRSLQNSPLYLDMSASIYSRLGLFIAAQPLLERAHELQPNVDIFKANLAANTVILGQTERAKALYTELLVRQPQHQRHHYQLARLDKAQDSNHLNQMLDIIERNGQPPNKNIFLYYAIGKELEDLQRWSEAFSYYQRASDAVSSVADYDVGKDLALINCIIETCHADWLDEQPLQISQPQDKTPVFVVGLPRSGTTLTERIISSHSQVESADETFFLQAAIRKAGGNQAPGAISPNILRAAARKKPSVIARSYRDSIDYKLGKAPFFVDKLPENFMYLGFIARSFPQARIVHLRRHPMDVCFAMYKQPFFRYAYSLADLGAYYLAFERLFKHWQALLGERLVVVDYETLVADQVNQTRHLLAQLQLPFEQACVDFDQNAAPSATASSVQVREKIHQRSVANWEHFKRELAPLYQQLEAGGIKL